MLFWLLSCQVTYQTEFFLDKNKDYVVPEHQATLIASTCPFVSGLFLPLPEDSSKQTKFSSIGARFKVCFLLAFDWPVLSIASCFWNILLCTWYSNNCNHCLRHLMLQSLIMFVAWSQIIFWSQKFLRIKMYSSSFVVGYALITLSIKNYTIFAKLNASQLNLF